MTGLIGPLGIVYVILNNLLNMGNYYPLITGILLIVTVILNPVGIATETRKQLDALSRIASARRQARRARSAGEPRENSLPMEAEVGPK